ncbi:MAG TPA: hypothetical protein VNX47_01265 [Nevskia sp.]|jgi:hypothetical protein|nr:hypothetical protein [Nevskia sp.]
MKCPACDYQLVTETSTGHPIVRNRGILIKAGALVLICPKCKGDVAPSQEVMKTLRHVSLLYFDPPIDPSQVVTK